MKFTRITVDPAQMGGVPCIRRLLMLKGIDPASAQSSVTTFRRTVGEKFSARCHNEASGVDLSHGRKLCV